MKLCIRPTVNREGVGFCWSRGQCLVSWAYRTSPVTAFIRTCRRLARKVKMRCAQALENYRRVCPSRCGSRGFVLCVFGLLRLLQADELVRFCPCRHFHGSLSTPTAFCFLYRLRSDWPGGFHHVFNNWRTEHDSLRAHRIHCCELAETAKFTEWRRRTRLKL